MSRKLLAALFAAVPALFPAIAEAQRASTAKNATSVTVINGRSVAVTGLEIKASDGKNVAPLRAALAPGKRQTFKIPPRSGCVFSVQASFADEADFDQSEVDLCTDRNVRFTD